MYCNVEGEIFTRICDSDGKSLLLMHYIVVYFWGSETEMASLTP